MIRLDKFLADAGYGTRSEVKKQLKSGIVSVNGAVCKKPEEKIALFSEYDRAMDLALSMAYERQNILKLKEVFEVDSREKKLAV